MAAIEKLDTHYKALILIVRTCSAQMKGLNSGTAENRRQR